MCLFHVAHENKTHVIHCVLIFTELTPVSSVSVDYTCTTHSATVQWTAVLGAESYRAIAVGDNGTQLTCTSQATSCQISGLDCGQSYVVHVTPVSESCTNMMNATSATFQTGEKQLTWRKEARVITLWPTLTSSTL